tara:strand:+ start:276 stop:581 length:306 start_codon:yes stop_codon:yes gene_type:complete
MKSYCEFVYRVFKKNEFEKFKEKKSFSGSLLDKKSGFIHLSTKQQIFGTIKKYYSEEKSLKIVKFKISDLKHKLKWEKSRNEDFFPHFYGTLLFNWVIEIK